MRILVTGASGYIGRHIVEALRAQNHDLVLTSRRAHKGSKSQDWRVVDFATAHSVDDWREHVENVELVINAVGIFKQTRSQTFEALHDKAPRALFNACKQSGVKRIIQISALGTDEMATSHYHLSKKSADDALADLGIEWVVLRPSLIVGGEGVSWRFFQALATLPIVPVIGNGMQPLQPISIADVTKAALASIHRSEVLGKRIDLVGSECLKLENYLQVLSKWLGREKFFPVHIPYGLAAPLASISGLFVNMPLNRQAVLMLKGARRYNEKEGADSLGFAPKGLSSYLSRHPAAQQVRIATSLYFLGPLLRISLAFMWIVAGVVSLFFYPVDQSLTLLAKLGFTGGMGMMALYGAALLDIFIGLSLLLRFWINQIAMLQLALICAYTLALSWAAPDMWADPFGPLAKNVPLIAAILIMRKLEE